MSKINKYEDFSWDFRTDFTKEYTHCFHSYPAMMIPQIVRRVIKEYGTNAEILFDPYCGTGTSFVEANLVGINSIGTDLNPLARLISKAKTTLLNIDELKDTTANYYDYIVKYRYNMNEIDLVESPSFTNIDYWFSQDVQKKLMIIKNFITSIKDNNIKNFFLVAFSEVIRESSWTRNGEFKLYRMSEKKMEQFNPKVFEIFEKKIKRNTDGLISYLNAKVNGSDTKIFSFNSVDPIPSDIIDKRSIDIVITSPPYGDSRTTVAYGQFSRLSNQWMEVENSNQIDNLLMGGKKKDTNISFGIDILDIVLKKIADIDNKRASEVVSFYDDYQKSIKNVSSVVKDNGIVCFVVGNRKVKGNILPTDEITRLMFEKNNFVHIKTIIRNIPKKRMPRKNSPTNKSGVLESTMNNEYIIIMQKKD